MTRGGQPWRLVFYILPTGRCPTFEFLQQLRTENLKAFLAFRNVKKPHLEQFGPSVSRPLWGGLGDGLGEIRWKGPNRGNFRIYACAESGRRLLLFFGDNKRWRTFPKEHRKTCLRYRTDFRSKDYDQEKREYLACAYYQRRNREFA